MAGGGGMLVKQDPEGPWPETPGKSCLAGSAGRAFSGIQPESPELTVLHQVRTLRASDTFPLVHKLEQNQKPFNSGYTLPRSVHGGCCPPVGTPRCVRNEQVGTPRAVRERPGPQNPPCGQQALALVWSLLPLSPSSVPSS